MKDLSRYVASARRLCLWIVAVGTASVLLTLPEREFRENLIVFGYIEKLLASRMLVEIGDISGTTLTKADVALFDPRYALEQTYQRVERSNRLWEAVRAGPSNKEEYERVRAEIEEEEDADQTLGRAENTRIFRRVSLRSAPAGSCPFVVTQGMDQSLTVAFADTQFKPGADAKVSGRQLYLVEFASNCGREVGSPPALLADLRTEFGEWYLAVSPEIARRLDLFGSNNLIYKFRTEVNSFDAKTLMQPAPVAWKAHQIETIPTSALFFPASVIEAKVTSAAFRTTGSLLALEQVDMALSEIFSRKLTNVSTFANVPSDVELTVFLSPLVLLALSFALWHRLRRVRSGYSGEFVQEEPWILINPIGHVEKVVAVFWALMLLGAQAAAQDAVLTMAGAEIEVVRPLLAAFQISQSLGMSTGMRILIAGNNWPVAVAFWMWVGGVFFTIWSWKLLLGINSVARASNPLTKNQQDAS